MKSKDKFELKLSPLQKPKKNLGYISEEKEECETLSNIETNPDLDKLEQEMEQLAFKSTSVESYPNLILKKKQQDNNKIPKGTCQITFDFDTDGAKTMNGKFKFRQSNDESKD